MDERQWSACADPTVMLDYLRGRVSDRKLRLFAVACCRHIWDLLPDERSRDAVDVAERYADGLANERERARARALAIGATGRRSNRSAWAAYWASSRNVADSLWNVREAAAGAVADDAADTRGSDWRAACEAYEAGRSAGDTHQAGLLRDITGNPFRPAFVEPAWLHWRGGLIAQMARQMYQDRQFTDLPILADALEEAGCADEAILAHCRLPGEHVRGCWVIDLLTGRA